MIKCPLLLAALACAISAAALDAQSVTRSKKAAVNITGEFRENGSCQVFADGAPVFLPTDGAQTTYIHDATLNVAPSGFDVHEVWCAPRGPEHPMPPLDYTERLFVLLLYAPTGKLPQTRSYDVRTGMPTAEAADHLVGAALFGMSPQVTDDSMPIRVGLMYLTGIRGAVDITRVDREHIAGTFVIVAQPARTL